MLCSESKSTAATHQGRSGSSDQVTRPVKRIRLIAGKHNKGRLTIANRSSRTRLMQEYVDKKGA